MYSQSWAPEAMKQSFFAVFNVLPFHRSRICLNCLNALTKNVLMQGSDDL
jgi:hypothetical protein